MGRLKKNWKCKGVGGKTIVVFLSEKRPFFLKRIYTPDRIMQHFF